MATDKPNYPVPRCLWETVEAILQTEARRFVREIATSLGQSEQPLLDELKREKLAVHLVDCSEPTEEIFLCRSYLQEKNMLIQCYAPVVFGTSFCPLHRAASVVELPPDVPRLRRLVSEEGQIFFYNELTRNVYNTQFEYCGVFSRSDPPVLRLVEIETEDGDNQ